MSLMSSSDRPQNAEPPTLSVLITCYNESEFILDSIRNVVGAIQDAEVKGEVLIIDDCSKDNSVEIVRKYIKENPGHCVRLKANSVNRGLAQNYVDGAFLTSGKYYRMCCGDDAEPRAVLANIFKRVGQADVIVPFQIQEEVEGKSPFRRDISKLFTFLVNFISGYHIRYYNGIAIHLRYNVMRYHPSSYGFGFQADILTRVLDQGASFVEVASSSVDRKGDKTSALTMRNLLSVGHTLMEILVRRVKNELYGKPRSPIPGSEVIFEADANLSHG
jgi:glycosyltransferase involved in cell wall biosynthesis